MAQIAHILIHLPADDLHQTEGMVVFRLLLSLSVPVRRPPLLLLLLVMMVTVPLVLMFVMLVLDILLQL